MTHQPVLPEWGIDPTEYSVHQVRQLDFRRLLIAQPFLPESNVILVQKRLSLRRCRSEGHSFPRCQACHPPKLVLPTGDSVGLLQVRDDAELETPPGRILREK